MLTLVRYLLYREIINMDNKSYTYWCRRYFISLRNGFV